MAASDEPDPQRLPEELAVHGGKAQQVALSLVRREPTYEKEVSGVSCPAAQSIPIGCAVQHRGDLVKGRQYLDAIR